MYSRSEARKIIAEKRAAERKAAREAAAEEPPYYIDVPDADDPGTCYPGTCHLGTCTGEGEFVPNTPKCLPKRCEDYSASRPFKAEGLGGYGGQICPATASDGPCKLGDKSFGSYGPLHAAKWCVL